MVHGIREVLRLQTKPAVLLADKAAQTGQGAIQKIAGVKLHARLRGVDLQDAARLRIVNAGGETEGLPAIVQHDIMIVAGGLRLALAQASANRRGLGKIERRILDADAFASRNQSV